MGDVYDLMWDSGREPLVVGGLQWRAAVERSAAVKGSSEWREISVVQKNTKDQCLKKGTACIKVFVDTDGSVIRRLLIRRG